MNTTFYTRLTQLRRELEASDSSDTFGLNVLLAIRRELVRLMQSIPDKQVQKLPKDLQHTFSHSFRKLIARVPFPAPGWEQQYQETEQALTVLEQIAQQQPLQLPAIPALSHLTEGE
ncbi:hypothetical protein [Hymenobacter metallicola]|uniref:Uncharacterized protein n=1 Tax=Hymenobacter metallicola TaxID=2563114 RepID=A0A4Z0Q1L0_9BACT|nr:hypothetical protein [Hymenobacter metallicola]TGE23494.1 hypothetical protein E5K02_20110 [Hymenobacter metallicola]